MKRNLRQCGPVLLFFAVFLLQLSHAASDVGGAEELRNIEELIEAPVPKKKRIQPPQPLPPSRIEQILNHYLRLSTAPLGIRDEAQLRDLQQFGYEIFSSNGDESLPARGPVSTDYRLGPGDSLVITIWGVTEALYQVKVSAEGSILLPKAGAIPVAGVRFGELEGYLRKHLEKFYRDFQLSVSIGQVKSIRVHIIGEVARPGQYYLNSLSMLLHGLSQAGGPTKRGSLRHLQLHREGQEPEEIDLYRFLTSGEKAPDVPLMHGDTVFVPILGPVVGIAGNVVRPAIYEFKENERLPDLLEYAGGILPVGRKNFLQLERTVDHERREIVDLHLQDELPSLTLSNMDIVKIFPIHDKIEAFVTLHGHVKHPGEYAWKEGMRLSDLLTQDKLLSSAYLGHVEIVHALEGREKVVLVPLKRLFAGAADADPELMQRDRISIFSEERAAGKIQLRGEVQLPSEYILQKGERLSSVLRRAGGFTDEAYPQGVKFSRSSVAQLQRESIEKVIQRLELELVREQATSAVALSTETAVVDQEEKAAHQTLIEKLRSAPVEGRVVIRLTRDLSQFEGTPDDLVLVDGDEIEIPRLPSTVVVLGAVYNPSAIAWNPKWDARDYLREVGGMAKHASKKEVHILKMNGQVIAQNQRAFSRLRLDPGDVINVPEKVERKGRSLIALRDISQILLNVGTVSALFLVAF